MADNNDFDEWLDDVETDDDGELDQLNIDALLSAVDDEPEPEDKEASTPSELDQTNIDALLGITNETTSGTASPTSSPESDELDQDNIDALLNGDDNGSDELDQDNIDALLNADDNGSDELDQDNIDALLNGDDDNGSDELDQDNIDALLGGGDDNGSDELDQDNIDALLSGNDDNGSDELDQDNIDALLNGDDDSGSDELEQDNIDALLSGNDDNDSDELDQDNIDALLGGDDDTSPAESSPDLVQDDLDELFAEDSSAEKVDADDEIDDIDALFNDIDAATLGEEGETETTLSTEGAEETAFDSEFDEMDQLFTELDNESPDENDPFQAEEIDFAEMLDSSDSGGDDEFLSLGDEEEKDDNEFSVGTESENDGNETDIDALLIADDKGKNTDEDNKSKKSITIPAFITNMNRVTMSAIGGGFVLLLIFGLYFMFSGNEAEDITVADNEIAGEDKSTTPAAIQANFIPIAEDNTFTMAENGEEFAIELKAKDEDGQPLFYDVTIKPRHGRLSGTAPNLTYLANTDFPGKDSFEYTVSDGTDTSAIAHIIITGPDLKSQALAQELAEKNRRQQIAAKELKPKQPAVLAKNVQLHTASTSPITINWRKIWQEANNSDYNPKTHVEIVETETTGKLGSVTGSRTTFTPDPYSENTDLIFYRFKKNGFRSKIKTISIDISLGDPAPKIQLADFREGYAVGQHVTLDASPSLDDAPDSLQFTWEQTSGVTVSLEIRDNGRMMTFVMPSSFYTKENPGPTFTLTAIDQNGQTTTKEIATKSISRRQAALWRSDNGSVADDPALEGKYFPWPYDD